MARRKAIRPGVLGPKEATPTVDPQPPLLWTEPAAREAGCTQDKQTVPDHATTNALRSGSPVRWRSMENPPLLHEQDTLGWAEPGRIRTRSRGFRPEVEGADFFFVPFRTARRVLQGAVAPQSRGVQSKMTVRLPRTKTRSSMCRRSPRAKASRSHNRPFRRRSAGESRWEIRRTS